MPAFGSPLSRGDAVGGQDPSLDKQFAVENRRHVFTKAKPAMKVLVIIMSIGFLFPALAGTGCEKVVPPGITLSLASGSPGTSVAIKGAAFGSGESGITVVFDDGVIATDVSANPEGAWSCSFVVPASPSGPHSVAVFGPLTQTASATFTTTPSISLDKTSCSPGSSITIVERGFAAHEQGINVTYDGSPVMTGASADSSGSWTAILKIPPSVSGYHAVAASESRTAKPGAASQSGFNVIPGVASSPKAGYVDSPVSVSGSGFAASSQLRVTYDNVGITMKGAVSDHVGNLALSITIPKSNAGTHSVVVSDSQGNTANTTFMVETFSLVGKMAGRGATQGIATNGAGFYLISRSSIEKYNNSWMQTAADRDAGTEAGVNHLGDGAFCNGKLYVAALRWNDESHWGDARIAVWNADLTFDAYHSVSNQSFDPSGLAIDAPNDIIFVSSFHTNDKVWKYRLSDYSYAGQVTLETASPHTQGIQPTKMAGCSCMMATTAA